MNSTNGLEALHELLAAEAPTSGLPQYLLLKLSTSQEHLVEQSRNLRIHTVTAFRTKHLCGLLILNLLG